MTEYTALTVFELTYGHDSENIHTRWLLEFDVHENGAVTGIDVRGKSRVVGPAMPYSMAERDDVPPDVEVDEELMKAHKRAEEDLTDQ